MCGKFGGRAILLNIVLVEPEIPQNTGNIARTCAATGMRLHLVEPLGFSIDDKYVKRAGLDYWNLVDIRTYKNLDMFFEQNAEGKFFFSSTKGGNVYTDVKYHDNTYILFGKETKGLPEDLLRQNRDKIVRIPMVSASRSLNLSNSVAVVAYEALRQLGFKGLQLEGNLPEE